MTFAKRQRAQLLEKMRELGPFAETACEGWKTQDLAAHLWVREHKPAALPGIGLERFAALIIFVFLIPYSASVYQGLGYIMQSFFSDSIVRSVRYS